MASLLIFALADEESRGLVLQKGQNENNAGHDDVQAGGDKPLVVACVWNMESAAVVCEVGQDNANIDGTSEETCAKTSNTSGRDFGNVDGTGRERS